MQIQAHDRKDVRLYYGTRNTGATAYSDLDDSWKAAGVDIVHVYSDDDKGYVQDVFSKVRRSSMSVCTLSTIQTPAPSHSYFLGRSGAGCHFFKTNLLDELQRCMNFKLLM